MDDSSQPLDLEIFSTILDFKTFSMIFARDE